MFNSRWFGKLATVTVYLSVLALLVYPDMPMKAVNVIMILSESVILLSMVLYVIMFTSFIVNPRKDDENDAEGE